MQSDKEQILLQQNLIQDQEKLISLHERFREQTEKLHHINQLLFNTDGEISALKQENSCLKDQSAGRDLIDLDATNHALTINQPLDENHSTIALLAPILEEKSSATAIRSSTDMNLSFRTKVIELMFDFML